MLGARGTGKNTLLKGLFAERSDVVWIDLLNLYEEDAFVFVKKCTAAK
jgi:predicted AAA+ superfamily ATPase